MAFESQQELYVQARISRKITGRNEKEKAKTDMSNEDLTLYLIQCLFSIYTAIISKIE
jgi:hypothetical protein